ncbi:MAG: radical SAM protein, partial [Spirochaetes bacterium]
LMVISPSMKCNLNCYGCYAGDYSKDGELSFDEVDSIITQAKEMGTYLIFFSGGEPFFWDGIFDIFKKHSDVNFQVYTHGGLLDEKNVEKIVEAGNVLPAISMEGYEKETDARRGKGHFKKVMRAMDLLKEAGNLFAVSYTQTKENTHIITSDEYIDFLIEKGAILIWIFTYVPIGRKPNIHLMATPEQRDFMRKRLAYFRATKPILFIDFWNDGHLVDGCVAGGKKYIHINARGDAEPCVFCHFASDNIREKSLLEILKSPLFKEIQSRQPYNKNLYRPCMLIDNPEVGRDIALKHAKYFTHPGAESLFTVLAKDIDEYAKKYGQLADKAWNEKVNISEGKKMAS